MAILCPLWVSLAAKTMFFSASAIAWQFKIFTLIRLIGMSLLYNDMLCQHPGKGTFRRSVLQSSSRLKCSQPVRIVPGIFFGFLFQGVGTEPHLLVKNSIDFLLRNVTFLLFENRKPATLKHLRIAGK